MNYKEEYANYIVEHINNVRAAFDWLMDHGINKKVDFGDILLIEKRLQKHDLSKWSEEEFEPYAHYFYVKKDNQAEFDKAWNHHQKNNPHHWQYWVLIKDNPVDEDDILIPMDKEYIVEMICDWWSFSFKANKLTSIFDWYKENKKFQKMHPDTIKMVEDILDAIKEELAKPQD